jgi:hypothetical protein
MAKVKLSAIRAQFPMYADLSDDQLLSGVRQKFYADIPPARFAAMVDYDTQREALGREVTDEMGTGGRFLAGIGKGMTDIAQGVGQMVGLQSREDVRNKRRTDEALSNTTAGTVGGVVGAVAPMLPLALVPGANTYLGAAAIGGGTGLAAPSESTGETLQNLALGGGAGAGGLALGRALGAGTRAVGGLMEPFTKAGQERIAARTLQQFASNPAQAAQALGSARQLVPNSAPTMAQASGDAGLAQLERTLVNNPETGPLLTGQFAAQRAARLGAVQDVAGTDSYFNAIKDGIRTFAREDYNSAFAAGFDPKALAANKDRLTSILSRPSIRQAQNVARQLAEESGETLDGLGSVRGLDYLVKALDNQISAAKKPGTSIGNAELRALVGTKNDLMGLIEKVAPAYREARSNFAAMSKQANAMEVARDVLGRMQAPLGRYGANTNELRNEYARALEAATESVRRSTGQDVPLSAVMPTRDISALEAVARDMARASTAENLGRATGSNTAQNLAAQNLLRRTLGPTGLPQSWAESNALQALLSPLTGLAKLSGSEAATMQRLAAAAMDPADAASLLTLAQQPSRSGVAALNALRYVPVLPAAYSSQQ